jgi:hypothetical protein
LQSNFLPAKEDLLIVALLAMKASPQASILSFKVPVSAFSI